MVGSGTYQYVTCSWLTCWLTAMSVALELAPIKCLSFQTRQSLGALDIKRVLPTPDQKLMRDWRGLASLACLPQELQSNLHTQKHPTAALLIHWQNKPIDKANLFLLQEYLQMIDRFDILDDTAQSIEYDALNYFNEKKLLIKKNQHLVHNSSSNYNHYDSMTVDDIQSNTIQKYNAYILFAEEDRDFAEEVIHELESSGFKLCVKDRDMLGGSSEHSGVMNLISERCERLIVILSPAFCEGVRNQFFLDHAQAHAVDNQLQRKILPILYKNCIKPPQLAYCHSLNYERLDRQLFWKKLKDSVTVSPSTHVTSIVQEKLPIINKAPEKIPRRKNILHEKPRIENHVIPNNLSSSNSIIPKLQSSSLENLSLGKNGPNNDKYDASNITENKYNSVSNLNSKIKKEKGKKNIIHKIRKMIKG